MYRVVTPILGSHSRTMGGGLFLFSALTLGGLALQTRQILQGRDPIPIVNEDGGINQEFVVMTLLYGDGVPFIGDPLPELLGFDIAKGTETRRDVLDLMPTVGLGKRIFGPTAEAIGQLVDGDYDRAVQTLGGEQLAELGRNLTALPGGNIRYVRTVIDRFLFSQWEALVDPQGFEDKTSRRKAYLRVQGQQFYLDSGSDGS